MHLYILHVPYTIDGIRAHISGIALQSTGKKCWFWWRYFSIWGRSEALGAPLFLQLAAYRCVRSLLIINNWKKDADTHKKAPVDSIYLLSNEPTIFISPRRKRSNWVNFLSNSLFLHLSYSWLIWQTCTVYARAMSPSPTMTEKSVAGWLG